MERKVCDRCDAEFGCGRTSPEGRCWCAGLPPVMPVPATEGDCLCPSCLEKDVASRIRIVSLLPAATDIL
ncbi:MAG TPA: cysteine-rich CWC family protein, partial [Planctomycetota bacterium]|nr:cysteine-rich CWC family protein [Planctomycetota bacterium]